MFKRMLRSVLVTTFSAGLALGVLGTLDLGWQGAPSSTSPLSASSTDLGWNVAPGGAGA
jgi:hypothetical protein